MAATSHSATMANPHSTDGGQSSVPKSADYVVVGAGAAGCAAARILATNLDASVLLLESGGTNKRADVERPAAWSELLETDTNWGYETVQQEGAAGRQIGIPMGRVLGGSSSVNGMMYMRGGAWDYEGWNEAGNPGWDPETVYEAYRQIESLPDGDGEIYGRKGPLKLLQVPVEHPLTVAYLAAGAELGYPPTQDFNGGDQEGVGVIPLNIHEGKRQDAYTAFIAPIEDRGNLTVISGATARRLILNESDDRVVALELQLGEELHTIQIGTELVVSCGAIASPQLLLMSGIGVPEELRAVGVEARVNLPGVGRNFHDHIGAPLAFESSRPIPPGQYQLVEANTYLRSEGAAHYDLQIPMMQFPFLVLGFEGGDDGYTFFPGILDPRSRGSVKLTSNDPAAPPAVDPQYLSEPIDLENLVFALNAARELAWADAFADWRKREVAPGPDYSDLAELKRYVQATASTYYHPAGTCRMGRDEEAVVDNRLKVHGVENLRVADASIMPTVTTGNTNAPSMMIGWRAGGFAVQDAGHKVAWQADQVA
jgi:choline dehydrogenase